MAIFSFKRLLHSLRKTIEISMLILSVILIFTLLFSFLLFIFSMTFKTAQAQPHQPTPSLSQEAKSLFKIKYLDFIWQGHPQRIFIAQTHNKNQQNNQYQLYLLDANRQLPMLLNEFSRNKQDKAKNSLPLIIGLGYPLSPKEIIQARQRDYTYLTNNTFKNGGGAENFSQFIKQVVFPLIEKESNIKQSTKLITGHSFGGLFTVYLFLNHTDSFNYYIAGSPSLWWGNGQLLRTNQTFKNNQFNTSSAHIPFISLLQGEYEAYPERDPNMTPERLERINSRSLANYRRQLESLLKLQQINYSSKLISAANHGMMIDYTLKEAIQLFDKLIP